MPIQSSFRTPSPRSKSIKESSLTYRDSRSVLSEEITGTLQTTVTCTRGISSSCRPDHDRVANLAGPIHPECSHIDPPVSMNRVIQGRHMRIDSLYVLQVEVENSFAMSLVIR